MMSVVQSVCLSVIFNQSISVKFVGRHYTTRPGAPTVVSGKHDQKVHSCLRNPRISETAEAREFKFCMLT